MTDKKDSIEDGKSLAILAYVLIIGTLIAWSINSEKKNKFASFHIRQALGLDLLFIVFGVLVTGFDSWIVTTPFYLFVMVLWGFGLAGAVQGKITYLPFFGDLFQKWFKKIA